MYMIRWALFPVLYITVPLCIAALILHYKKRSAVVYTSSLASLLVKHGFKASPWYAWILKAIRIVLISFLALLCARPQLVDVKRRMIVDGIDIVLTLDVSGSMQSVDFEDDARSRFTIAQEEAIRFVHKRVHDAIGLVIFGNDAVTRLPVTHDKKMLETMINELRLGDIDPNGTKLSTALLSATNRLKRSQSKSKVIILLTDGEPSPGDIHPEKAVAVVKQLGIKVYTIGIGSQEEGYVYSALGINKIPRVNKELLNYIAQETGGKSFIARNAADMRSIYNSIDMLEKTEHEVPLFSDYVELFWYCCWALLFLICIHPLLVTFVWFGL